MAQGLHPRRTTRREAGRVKVCVFLWDQAGTKGLNVGLEPWETGARQASVKGPTWPGDG